MSIQFSHGAEAGRRGKQKARLGQPGQETLKGACQGPCAGGCVHTTLSKVLGPLQWMAQEEGVGFWLSPSSLSFYKREPCCFLGELGSPELAWS